MSQHDELFMDLVVKTKAAEDARNRRNELREAFEQANSAMDRAEHEVQEATARLAREARRVAFKDASSKAGADE